jgi:hypothetical protein
VTIRWPKPYCKVLTRDQIRLIMRIYLLDKQVRKKNGFKNCTVGLKARLAAEFGVKRKLVDEITESTKSNRRKFRDINIPLEGNNARYQRKRRRAYRAAIAGHGSEQDPAGTG